MLPVKRDDSTYPLSNSRLTRWSQWVDATLSLNPPSIENKSRNCYLALDQHERCPG